MGSSSLTIRQIFFLRAFQEVSDKGKKQQSPGHVGPSVGPWAGGGALPLTSGMAAVTQASHPAAWHHVHPTVTSFLKQLVASSKSKPTNSTGTYCGGLLYRIAAFAVKVKNKNKKIKKFILFKFQLWSSPVYYLV